MYLAKSPNKHNRLYAKSSPLEEGLTDDIENGTINRYENIKI